MLKAAGIVSPTISAHCAAYAHLSAKWGLEYADKFVPESVAAKGAQYVEDWSEEYLIGMLENGVASGIHIFGWFWACGASGSAQRLSLGLRLGRHAGQGTRSFSRQDRQNPRQSQPAERVPRA